MALNAPEVKALIDVAMKHVERRITETTIQYIDAQRKGFLMRRHYCCDDFHALAKKLWLEHIYDEKTDPPLAAIAYHGALFNFCPFCGEKL